MENTHKATRDELLGTLHEVVAGMSDALLARLVDAAAVINEVARTRSEQDAVENDLVVKAARILPPGLQWAPQWAPRIVGQPMTVQELADKTADAYSADRYASWTGVIRALRKAGHTDREINAIVRSKWARWAADESERRYGRVPAKVLVEYARRYAKDLPQLVRETEELA